ncbi:MAG: AAC(3) family N-acetyltransferase [Defluviitaleaceae bacterium]|nr:AAC(3) family N-acetyltransferase [Defluviitaleaceae bacterium]MCL2275540.1 AAC(3) family N-acetyltransferase [Defluviitaleaceae bacterium]
MVHKQMLLDLQAMGVMPGANLLVHSSFKSLGKDVESPAQVIETLRFALGEEGTLLIPALTYEQVPVFPEEKRVFDVRNTPSDVGIISETFRKMEGVVRSLHPTHSVAAAGKRTQEFVANHEKDSTPVGENSPFRKLRDAKGFILMLGCGLAPNTSMHGVEELAGAPYCLRHVFDYLCTDAQGATHTLNIRRHHFCNAHGEKIHQRYDRLKYILPGYVLAGGKVLDADCYIIAAKLMWDIAEKVMRDDPLFFVDDAASIINE